MSISASAVLVELNIGTPTFRKLDRKTSDEVNVDKQAIRGASRVNVHLLAGTDKLEQIHKFVASTRAEFYYRTLPWSDSGQRLVPMAMFFELSDWLGEQEIRFTELVSEFLVEYPTIVAAQAFKMGTFFDRTQYPPVEDIKAKFKFNKFFLPVPESGDFRVDIEETMRKDLTEEFDRVYSTRTASAMNDIWDRLYTTLTHISERLTPTKEGEKKVIRESVIGNALELCEILTKLNVTNDPALEKARKMLESTLRGVELEDLKDERIKKDIRSAVDGILSSFNF